MVVAWIMTSTASFRPHEDIDLPRRKEHVRRRKDLRIHDVEKLRDAFRQDDAVPDAGRFPDSAIVGLASLSPGFQYDHTKLLSPLERAQYRHWCGKIGVPASDLWYFNVDHVHALHNGIDAKVFVARQVSKTLKVLEPRACRALLDDFAMQPGYRPHWLPGDALVELCLVLPNQFAELCVVGALRRLAMPSPLSNGHFGTPRWFRSQLQPNLGQQFRNTVVRGGLQDLPPFALQDTSA